MIAGAELVLNGAHFFLTGMLIGVVIAAPIGPVNIMCIQRALERGFWGGVSAGLGAVAGDGLIAAFAAFGMTAVSSLIKSNKPMIQLVGGIILIAFGIKLFMTVPRTNSRGKTSLRRHAAVVPQTFLLTISNPGAVLGTAAIFGGFGSLVGGLENYLDATMIVVGVMTGSLCWWMALSKFISVIHHRLDQASLLLINRVAGVVLAGFGAGLLGRFFLGHGIFG
ncbi:MAG: LysE family transporter [Pseudomonadota bacterium]|nr:LysE family transporter [Pseudomonadota bacterium]